MKRLIATSVLLFFIALLGGCYYDPGYSYVRGGGTHGDAYYGRGSVRYDDGYYAPYYDGYAPGYYGSYAGYPCCYGSGVVVGVGTSWRSAPRYRDDYRRDRDGHYDRDRGWYGHRDGDRSQVYDRRRQDDRAIRGRSDNGSHAYTQRVDPRERADTPRGRPAPRSRDDARDREERHRSRYEQR